MKIPKLLLAIAVAGLAMVASQAQTWTGVDVGSPATAGSHTVNGDGTLTIKGGGADIWGNADQFYYYYTPITGGFDAWMNVSSLTGPNTWTKCEIMARWVEGGVPAAGDPHVSQTTTPDLSNTPAGVNLIQPQWRTARGGASGNTDAVNIAPAYPNVWMRLKRSGQTWDLFRSTDGVNWGDPYYTVTTTGWPDTVLVGIAVTSHDNSAGALATAVTSPITFNATPTIAASGNALGSQTLVFDSLAETVTGVTQVLLDGVDITGDTDISKTSTTTTIDYDIVAATGGYFVSGSTHTVEVTYTSGAGGGTLSADFTVDSYLVVPGDLKSTAGPQAGFEGEMNVFVTQGSQARRPNANSLAGLEQQLAGAMRDASGNIMDNVAANSAPPSVNDNPLDVNYNVGGGNINDTDPQPDNFNSGNGFDNADVSPFIDSADAYLGENFVFEFYGWIELDAGFHTMGVNSDDGFKLSIGKSPRDIFGIVLGQFDGGRGAANTIFDFMIEESGIYPFRLVWGQGGGGGNAEWFYVMDDGQMILINDPNQNPIIGGPGFTTSLYTWPSGGTARAAVTKLVPANGYTGVDPMDTIQWEITAGRTSAVAGQTKLVLDGVEVISNGGATGTYTPAEELIFGSQHTGQLIWTESGDNIVHTEDFSFSVRTEGLEDLGFGFFIEAEDYDYGSGQSLAIASDMSATGYAGGGYQSTAGGPYNPVWNIDMSSNTDQTRDGGAWVYRQTSTNDLVDPTVLVHQPDGGNDNTPINRTRKRGDEVITVTSDWKLGWMGGDKWFNYTRNIPAGIYKAFAVVSQDAENALVGGALQMVISGHGTDAQSVVTLGEFAGRTDAANATWGAGIWIPLRTAYADDAPPSFFKISEPSTTLRYVTHNGDFFHMQLAQAASSEVFPPIIRNSPVAYNYAIDRRGVELRWVIEDFTSAVDASSIMVEFGLEGAMADVTADASVTKDGDFTTITYTPVTPPLLAAASTYAYKLTFSDDAAEPVVQSSEGSVMTSYLPSDNGALASEGAFLIEVEDFNYDGGVTIGSASTMPYTGGAYAGLGAVLGIDYSREDIVDYTDDGQLYRPVDTVATAGVQPVLSVNNGTNTLRNVRDMMPDGTVTWNVENNYKIGWSGNPPNRWFNYTRSIPAGMYTVWAGMSVDNRGAGTMRSQLEQVVSGATTDTQVTVQMGVFDGGGTGTWGEVVLVPLLDNATDRNIQSVSIAGGQTTLRWIMDSGDQDYLVFLPSGEIVTGPKIDEIDLDGSGNIVISWTGDGMLQSVGSIPAGSWSDVTDVSPATVPVPGTGQAYYRVMGSN